MVPLDVLLLLITACIVKLTQQHMLPKQVHQLDIRTDVSMQGALLQHPYLEKQDTKSR